MNPVRDAAKYREESLRELRYLVAGVDALQSSTATITMHVAANLPDMAIGLAALCDQMWRTTALLEAQVQIQREVLDVLHNPRRTAATELLMRAGSAAERHLWPEATRDYDLSIEQNWDQPEAHLGRGLAVLGAAGIDGRTPEVLTEAAESFERALRYGAGVSPQVAVRATQLAIAVRDRLGQKGQADNLLKAALDQLPASPELAFSAGLRFQSEYLLDRAVALEPALAGDGAWLELPVAERLVARLARAQDAAIDEGLAALRAASKYGVGPVPSVVRTDPVTRLSALRAIDESLDAAQNSLRRSSPDEDSHNSQIRDLSQRVATAKANEYQRRRRRSAKDDWIISGIVGAIVLCPGSIVLSLVAGNPDGEPPNGLPILIAVAAVIVIGWPVLSALLGMTAAARAAAAAQALSRKVHDHNAARADVEADRRATADLADRAGVQVGRQVHRSPEAYEV